MKNLLLIVLLLNFVSVANAVMVKQSDAVNAAINICNNKQLELSKCPEYIQALQAENNSKTTTSNSSNNNQQN